MNVGQNTMVDIIFGLFMGLEIDKGKEALIDILFMK